LLKTKNEKWQIKKSSAEQWIQQRKNDLFLTDKGRSVAKSVMVQDSL